MRRINAAAFVLIMGFADRSWSYSKTTTEIAGYVVDGPAGVPTFRYCVVEGDWWLQKLIDQCGMPNLFLPWGPQQDGLCALYAVRDETYDSKQGEKTQSHVAVCLRATDDDDAPALRQKIPVRGLKATGVTRFRVVHTVRMRSAPPPVAKTGKEEYAVP